MFTTFFSQESQPQKEKPKKVTFIKLLPHLERHLKYTMATMKKVIDIQNIVSQ